MKTFLPQSTRVTTFLILLCFCTIGVTFGQRTSNATGNWSAAGTWVNANINRTGTVTSSNASSTVTGTSTLFLTELSVGSVITTQAGTAIGTVATINSNTSVTLTGNATNTVTGQTYRTTSGPPSPVDAVTITNNNSVTVNGIFTCASLSLGGNAANTNGTLTFSASGSPKLTATGAITMGGTNTNSNRTGVITFVSGSTLECSSLTIGNASNSPAILTMTNGSTLRAGSLAVGGTGTTWTPSTGTVELTATNTLPATIFTTFNNLTISSGTTKMGVNAAINGTLNLTGGNLDVNSFTGSAGEIIGSGNLTNTSTADVFTIGSLNTSTTYSGVISSALGVTKVGTGELILSGINTYTGTTTISAGTLSLGSAGIGGNSPLGTTAAGTIVSSGALLDLNGFTLTTAEAVTLNGTGITASGALTNTGVNASYSGNITLGSASSINATTLGTLTCSGTVTGAFGLTLDGAGIGTMSGIISTPTSVTKNGTGTWTLSAVNTYTGATAVTAGTLKLGSTTALGTSSVTTVSSGAVLDLNGFTLSTARPLTINGTGLTASPAGALTNTGGNASYSGNITLGSASTISTTSSGTLTSSGTVGTGAFGLTLDGAGTGTMSGIISTPNSFTKNGAGTWTLSGTNTYTGTNSLNTGTLTINNTAALGAAANAFLIANGATANVLSNVTVGTLGLGGTGVIIGSWGSTASTATNKNNTYFSGAALVNVTTGSCTAPTITLGTIPAICPGATSFTIPFTAVTAGVTQYSISGTGITTVTLGALPASPITVNLSSAAVTGTISFTLTVKNSVTGCVSGNVNSSVTVNPTPTVTNTTLTQTICSGATSSLVTLTSGVGGATFSWTASATTGVTGFTTSGTSTIPTQTISTSQLTQGTVTYVVTPTAGGCIGTPANYTILVNPLPSYSLDGITATTPTAPGSTSTVTVNGAALTNATYTVTYNLSGANSSTGNTASAVISSGTGTFTTVAIANAGATTVTITALIKTTDLCNATISTNNTATFSIANVTFTSSGSFTVPAGVNCLKVEAWGAGGGGGSCNFSFTGGGGGGAYASSVVAVTPGASLPYTVGTGGGAGTAGQNSTFNTSSVIAAGGSANSGATGGAGGTTASSTGTTKFAGGNGGNGAFAVSGGGGGGAGSTAAGGNASAATAGTGGSLNGGNGGTGPGTGTNGNSGANYGGGGSGTNSFGTNTGGSGANGLIKLSWIDVSNFSTSATTNLCSGSTSTVTVSSTTLDDGTYTVTYNLSGANSATGSTATLTFSGLIGTFTTSTLTNSGSTTLVITGVSYIGSSCNSTPTGLSGTTSITIIAPPTAASNTSTQTICATGTATLAGNTPSVGTGAWSVVSGPSLVTSQFSSLTNPTAVFTPAGGAGSYVLRWTISNSPCTASTANATITVTGTPTTATNTSTQTICATGTATLAGNTPSVGTGAWSVVSGPSLVTSQFSSLTNPTAVFTPAGGAGSYVLRWTISNSPCTASTANATITVTGTPTTATNTSTQTICATGTATLAGNTPSVGTGAWSVVSGPSLLTSQFSSLSNPTAVFTPAGGAGSYVLRWTISNSPCTASTANATITVTGTPTTATNTSTQTICATGTATLAGNTPSVGTGSWSVVSGPSLLTSQFSSLSSPTAVFTPAGGAGSYLIRWTISNAPCTASTADATITVSTATVAGAVSGGTTICSGSTSGLLTLSGQTGSVIRWESAVSPFSSWTTITNTTSTYTSGALTQTTQFRAVVQSGSCLTLNSTPTTVTIGGSTTWNGSAWSNGAPTSTTAATISGNYTSATNGGGFSACTLTVTSGTVIISSGDNVTLNGALTVTSGSFTLSNNANLIQNTSAANSGNIIVNRNTAALMRQDYVLWGSPVAGQQLQAFSPNTLSNRFYTYDSTLDQYAATSATANFSLGSGYLIRMPNNHPATPTVWTGTFTGVPNNGTVTVGSLTGNKYYSVGNPYPSTINADTFITDNSLTEALYFWRKTNNAATSSYATYTLAGGVSNSGGDPLGLTPNGFIQVGQGFIAKVPSGGNSLSFTNSMRVGNNSNQFLRNSLFERSRYWLNLTDDAGFFGQMMVAYMTGATNGYDPAIDGLFFGDSQTALTSLIDNQEYSIQGRALPFETTDVVTLGFKSQLGGNYTIALNNFDGLFDTNNQDIYLRDNLTTTLTNLKTGSYSFTSEAGVFNTRFEVVYENALGIASPENGSNQVIVYAQNNEVVVHSGSVKMATVQLYDLRGRLLVEKDNINGADIRINAGSHNQILIVKVRTVDDEIMTKKILY